MNWPSAGLWLKEVMTLFRYFLLSLLVHGFFFAGFLWWREPQVQKTTIEVTLNGKTKKSSPGKRQVGPKTFDFGLPTTKAVVQGFNSSEQIDQMEEPNDAFDPYNGLEMPEIRYVQSLWREIDKAIVNPSYLSEYGHVGKVFFVFDVGADGNLVEESIRVKAEDRVLKVIAARSIRKAVLNIHGELPKPRERTRIFSTFTWSDYQTCTHLRGSGKNTLSFCNYAEDKRKKFDTGEQVATYLGALKYGLDAVDEIQKYNREKMHRNTQFNPFEEYERDPDWDLGS